ncbi:MAG: hypothetical protein KGJ80_18620 [Chloroflexota bacterium]|nr:hypothetical protein [Chloroflexota bacterium]
MARGMIVAGIIGLAVGALIFLGARTIAAYWPNLIQGVGAAMVFLFLLLISLAEMPLMLYGFRQMARGKLTPRSLLAGAFGVYVAFGAVYAAIFVLLTSQFALGLALASLCLARFLSGGLVK